MSDEPRPRFDSELVELLRAVLDEAVDHICEENRTPATKAKMAERIVRTAASGVTDADALMCAAVEAGRTPAA
jgi:hypothetical protein